MKNQIKVRSYVKLNMDNAPLMQVEKIERNNVRCFWFDKTETPRVKTFHIDDLILHENNTKK